MKNSIKILSICNILLIAFLIGILSCCGGSKRDVGVQIRCLDENNSPVSNSRVIFGEQSGQTDENGECKMILKGMPKNKSKKIMVEINKEPSFEKVLMDIEIKKDQKHFEKDIVLNRNLSVEVVWEYAYGLKPVLVSGGKIQVKNSSDQKLVEDRTNEQGKVTLIFHAKRGTAVSVYGILESIIEAKYPKIPEPEKREIAIGDEVKYFINLKSGETKKTRTFMADVTGIDGLSDVTMAVNNEKVIYETKGNSAVYKGDFYQNDRVKLSLSHPEYDFEPLSKLLTVNQNIDVYPAQFQARKKSPMRAFIISCVDPENRPTTDIDVYIDGVRVEKNIENNQVKVIKRIDDGKAIVSLSNPEYGFIYTPGGGAFNITSNQMEYQLSAKGTYGFVTVEISCFEQTGQAISGIDISSNDNSIAGKTNSLGKLITKIEGDRTVRITFKKEGYLTDEDITLKVPKKGNISLERYLIKQNMSTQVLGICPFDYESPNLMVDASQSKKQITDRLRNEYNIITSDIEYMSDERLSKGWKDSEISADIILKGKLSRDESGNRINLSCNIFDKNGNAVILNPVLNPFIPNLANIMVKNIVEIYPFEGRIIGIDFNGVKINLGQSKNISVGNRFDIYHITRDKDGKTSDTPNRLYKGKADASGTIKQVDSDSSNINNTEDIREKIRNDKLSIGDIVKRALPIRPIAILTLTVKNPETNEPLEGMNIYYGSPLTYGDKTDVNGVVSFTIPKGQTIQILGQTLGWEINKSIMANDDELKIEYTAERLKYNLFVTSEPSNCTVFINGKQIGKTPIESYSIAGDSYEFKIVDEATRKGSRLLTIVIPDQSSERRFEAMGIEYKILGRDININIPILVSFDDERIKEAENLINTRKYAEAIEWLKPVSRNIKDDYLEARQLIGFIYVNHLGDYDKGIEAFNEIVTIDRQFASAYYNLGYCYYKKAEYDKAMDAFDEVIRNRSYLLDEDVMRIIHDTKFYLTKSQYEKEKGIQKSSMIKTITKAGDYNDFFNATLVNRAEYRKDKDYFDRSKGEINRILDEAKTYGK